MRHETYSPQIQTCDWSADLRYRSGFAFRSSEAGPRLLDGAAWLFIGGLLCFVPEFHLRFSRDSFLICVIGLLMVCAGTFVTALAVLSLFGYRAHGLSPFYMYIGIGTLFITAGIVVGFDRKNGA